MAQSELRLPPIDDNDPEDGLSIFDPGRCRCYMGYCTNRATDRGLCDRCHMEYAAMRNTYRGPGEWS